MSRNSTPWGDISDSASMISSEIAYESDDSVYESEIDSESDDEDVTLASDPSRSLISSGKVIFFHHDMFDIATEEEKKVTRSTESCLMFMSSIVTEVLYIKNPVLAVEGGKGTVGPPEHPSPSTDIIPLGGCHESCAGLRPVVCRGRPSVCHLSCRPPACHLS